MRYLRSIVPAAVLALGLSAFAHDGHDHEAEAKKAADTKPADLKGADGKPIPAYMLLADVYPLDTCIVTGKKLGKPDKIEMFEYEGRDIRLLDKDAKAKFDKEPAKYLAELDKKIVEMEKDSYPMTTCPVSGEKLEKPVMSVIGNRLFEFCCADCEKEAKANPAPALAKLNQAVIDKQLAAYPLQTCVVGGGKLESMGGAINFVHANRLVRMCCDGCVGLFRLEPQTYLSKLDEAVKKAKEDAAKKPATADEKKPS